MASFARLQDQNLQGKTVLLRADLNVPTKDGAVTDSTRIDRLKPTIEALRKMGARVAILSHFGRPKGRDETASLKQLVAACEASWGVALGFCDDCIGASARQAVAALQDGDVLLLENVRFHDGEEKNDPAFAKELASLGDFYVNDAFSAAHRAHASTTSLAELLPSAAGLLMEAELDALQKALGNPQRPVVAIAGGSKVSTKLELLNNLVTKVDVLVLGGGMANSFLLAEGFEIGKSLAESGMLDQAREIARKAAAANCRIILPVDVIVADAFAEGQRAEIVAVDAIPQDKMVLDLGPQTVANIATALAESKTLVWNGPLGAFEIKPFERGTMMLADAVCKLVAAGQLTAVAGGGDTVAALEMAQAADKLSYVSSAGGAFLEWMEGKTLPGVAALEKAYSRKSV